MEQVTERFLRYVRMDTQSSEESNSFPSTEKQKSLGRMLREELVQLGVKAEFDEEYGYVYGMIPATPGREQDPVLGFLAHMDTSPESSGRDVHPVIWKNYDGNDLVLNREQSIVLSVNAYPEITAYVGQTIITSDGTTLLGADDKAGVAEIMTMAAELMAHPELAHGPIAIGFTPDEEIGAGVDHFDVTRFGAQFAYTVDGGPIGELEYENFNAAALTVLVHGVTVHPGEAKNKMKNAMEIAMEYNNMLPAEQKPEYTCGYEGFFHLTQMSGTVESAELRYIIRDHDSGLFQAKKELAEAIGIYLNGKYGAGTVEVLLKDSYYNMRSRIVPRYEFLIAEAEQAMKELGIVPKIQPIRGGTDGARLSFMGLPCPNLCTGGHNFHGRFEYICAESMEKTVELLLKLATIQR